MFCENKQIYSNLVLFIFSIMITNISVYCVGAKRTNTYDFWIFPKWCRKKGEVKQTNIIFLS